MLTGTRPVQDLPDSWLVVERQSEGLLRYARARGIAALPVQYATWQHRIYLRLPVFNDAGNFVDRADLALDVDGSTDRRSSVTRVAGVGLVVPEAVVPAELGGVLESACRGVSTRAIALVPASVRQIPFVDDLRFPPLPDHGDRLPGTSVDAVDPPAPTCALSLVTATDTNQESHRS